MKFANLLPVGLAGIALPWLARSARGRRAACGLVFLALALAVAAPWMLRNAVHRGNPLFPAFYGQLGGAGWTPENAARMRAETGMNLDRSPRAGLERLAAIGWRGGYGSGGEVSRAWPLLLLLGLLLARGRAERALLLVAAASLVLGVFAFTSYLRVFTPALMLVALAPAIAWDRLRARPARACVVAAVAAVAIGGWITAFRLAEVVSGGASRVFAGGVSPREYLAQLVSYAPLARYVDEELESGARIRVIGSARTAYIHRVCEATYVWDDPWVSPLVDDPAAAPRLLAELREQGFTHVLLDTGEMDRLERGRGLYGYSRRPGGREGIDVLLAALEPRVEANGVYLFAVP